MITQIVTAIVLLGLLGAGGYYGWLRYRRKQLDSALRQKRLHGDRDLSIFDVFWDLGANEFALEVMRRDGMLVTHPSEFDGAHRALTEVIDAHGSYRVFIRETREVIREFSERYSSLDSREVIPVLKTDSRRLLSTEKVSGVVEVRSLNVDTERERGGDAETRARLGYLAGEGVDRAQQLRDEERVGDITGYSAVDLEEMTNFGIKDVLAGLFEGQIAKRLGRWWERRRLRSLKDELDQKLAELFYLYDRLSERQPEIPRRLYKEAKKWEREAARLRDLYRSFRSTDVGLELACASLVERARRLAAHVSQVMEHQIDNLLRKIHHLGHREDRPATAGYLVYQNRHALFVGCTDSGEYSKRVRKIDEVLDRIQNEVRRLSDK